MPAMARQRRKAAAVFQIHVEFAEDPFCDQKRDAQNQKENDKNGNTEKSNHMLIIRAGSQKGTARLLFFSISVPGRKSKRF